MSDQMGSVKKKYLIYAEDDVDDREMLAEMMQKISGDVDIVAVNDGYEVLRYLSSLGPTDYLPCFILLDINMPGMDGYSTLQALKSHEIYRSITVIMYSTANHSKEIERSIHYGAVKFITKPFSLSEIEEITKEFVHYCEILPMHQKGE
jgi:CheY-like chemotaxis protein